MRLPAEDINSAILQKKYADYFGFAEMFWSVTSPLLSENEVIGVGNTLPLNICACAVLAKQMRLYYACVSLCRSGLAHEAHLVLRTMLYTAAYLLALSKAEDRQRFARMWVMWDFAVAERNYTELKLSAHRWPDSKDIIEYSLEIKKEMSQEKWKTFLAYGPAFRNFRELCGELNYEGAYLTAFRASSSVVHGSDLLYYAKPDGDNSISCQLPPDGEDVDKVIVSSAVLLRDACVLGHDLLDLHKQELKSRIMEAFEAHKLLKRGVNRE